MPVHSMASLRVRGGRMPGRRFASMDLPTPGGPISKRLCPPAAAISRARRAPNWPRTSAKSGAGPALSPAKGAAGVGRSGSSPVRCRTTWAAVAAPYTRRPSTAAASAAFSAGTNFDGFAEWFAAVLLERELAVSEAARMPLKRGNRAREEIEKKYRFISEIKGALREFSPTLEGFYVEDGRLFVKPRGIPAEYLSQGEKSVAALISDIALRMSGANPAMKKPLSTDAIIMIDEVDLHLHPDWQAQIAVKLQKIFPNAQFIVSSHSPSVFSVVKSVYKLDEDGDGTMRFARSSQYGKAPADILGTFLNAGREGSVKAEIDAMYEALDAGDAGRAMKAIARLRRIIPDDPEVLRGEYLARAIGSSNVNGGTNAPH